MKSDQDVRMISAETPVVFARACEMFIMDITIRATQFAEYDNERLVLTKKSILDTIKHTDIFDFLMEIRQLYHILFHVYLQSFEWGQSEVMESSQKMGQNKQNDENDGEIGKGK